MSARKAKARPCCAFCQRSEGVQFQGLAPRFPPFGTACVECEATLPHGTKLPEAEPVRPLGIPTEESIALMLAAQAKVEQATEECAYVLWSVRWMLPARSAALAQAERALAARSEALEALAQAMKAVR